MSKRTEKYGHKLQSVKVRVKDAEQGLVEAVFSTFNVIDSDGDVTLPGAFEEGAPVRVSAYGQLVRNVDRLRQPSSAAVISRRCSVSLSRPRVLLRVNGGAVDDDAYPPVLVLPNVQIGVEMLAPARLVDP